MSKSTRGARVAGIASLAVTLSIGVAAPAFAAPGFEFTRIAGADRYETAVKASEQYGASDDVIIANGQPGEYADALAGNYLAGAEDAPILLTKRSGLPKVTKDRLATIDPTNVWIVGGEAAVPADQEAELTAAGYNVERIAGDDRFGTNAEVIAADGASTGGVGLIATGLNFPDALAAGPFAYKGHSLGLVRTNSVPDAVGDALEADGVKSVLIFGGTDVVGAGVVSDLAARGITVTERFAGADRSETSELAAEWAVKNLKFSDEHVGVASGYTEGFGADALAGGPVEGNENSPMLITRNVDNPDDVIDYLKAHAATLADGHIYGGTAAISAAAEAAMEAAAQGTASSAGSTNTRPELVSAQIVSTTTPTQQAAGGGPAGTVVRYTFDEEVTGATPTMANFHLYDFSGTPQGTPNFIQVETGGKSVLVRYTSVDSASEAGALSVATVDFGAVTDDENQVNPIGDAAVGAGQNQGLTAGTTAAPDLVAVENVRPNQTVNNETLVDFRFDEAAFIVDATASGGFALVLTDGTVEECTAVPGQAGGNPGINEAADNTITVSCTNPGGLNTDITAGQIARGTIDAGTVSDANEQSDGSAGTAPFAGSVNPLQASNTPDANSSDPDLVSAEFFPNGSDPDQVVYTFDEPVIVAPAITGTSFQVYKSNGGEEPGNGAVTQGSTSSKVVVSFDDGDLLTAVGASVDAGAVLASSGAAGRFNEEDEVGVANANTTAVPAGRTLNADLTGVALSTRNTASGPQAVATYTFDEDVDVTAANITTGNFYLVLADGTRLQCTAATGGTTEETDNTVTCTQFRFITNTGTQGDVANNTQVLNAVLGTVDDSAVLSADNSAGNVEGAEPTTGGTGTRTS